MLSLSGPGSVAEALLWLSEPATSTVQQIRTRTVALVEAVTEILLAAFVGDRQGWALPERQWAVGRDFVKPRTEQAASFQGFDESYPVPPPSQLNVHPHSVPRLELAERLRVAMNPTGGN